MFGKMRLTIQAMLLIPSDFVVGGKPV